MRLYRLARAAHAQDLTGDGARLYGGRWNRKGVAVLYTAPSRSLAILEFLVHLPLGLVPPDVELVELEVADEAGIRDLDRGLLPPDWSALPAPPRLADLGSEWIRQGDTAMLRVPSAIVEEEHNVLVNPGHPACDVRVVASKPFPIDPRLRGPRNLRR